MIESGELAAYSSHLAVHKDPQTLGYALTDSPMGTAAWIWERRRNWSDCDGDVEKAFEKSIFALRQRCFGVIEDKFFLEVVS